jgi:integrase
VPRSGARLVAYFGTMYYAALRPEEAAALGKRHLDIPAPTWDPKREDHVYGWGAFHLDEATPHVGGRWTNGGKPRDQRQLKSQAAGEGRTVPCPPDLTRLLWDHINRYGFGAGGLLFRETP